ncbi:M42 family metallopeptidase [Candidatus Poribacteria bacterium]|jgi:tetrahedral aminopeptidase|nr:M42 family metallopeptidase [Candidatus Poribacteria bacterium]MBT5535065.1 M42 family metallopeptidase [Candidatus Poribacteria bacterium]MBT5711911.1 M42 family metallopeptidase [Candidatus Poribacteria bacterium]MBT7101322.1 M42 family metallopeptidase [Candidatus Poribacteria bacterium]MBT7807321.1 M42 family metallopeptidase [Candidatus Poribacteria bacterium]
MREAGKTFLYELLDTPGPSGYEQPVQTCVRSYAEAFADSVVTDVHGNVVVGVNDGGAPRVMLAGHCDQIGFIVQHIDDDGFISFAGIGGHDATVLIGQRVRVWTRDGSVPGVIARKAIHLLSADERAKVSEIHALWIDIGARDGTEARAMAQVGDPVTFELGVTDLLNGNIASPGTDNKVGVWIVMEAARRVAEADAQAAVFAVSTVQEELGTRGAQTAAYAVRPDVGIAIDVNHATDVPGVDAKRYGDVKLGGGPVVVRGPNINPRVFDLVVAAAEEAAIPIQIVAHPGPTPTDARALQVAREGVATGLIKVPNRYMHSTVEVVNLGDVEQAAELLATFIMSLTAGADFTP